MAKVLSTSNATTTSSSAHVKWSVVGKPVESLSNIVGIDRTIKEACNIGGAVAPSYQRLLLELPIDEDILAVAQFII